MSVRLAERGITAVLLDIEGTTTPLAFVHEVLFPFARARLAGWVARHCQDPVFADIVARLTAEHVDDQHRDASVPAWRHDPPAALRASVEAYAHWLMDRDRKSPGLKLLQAHVWEEGFQSGELRGQVFSDVPSAIRRWHASGVTVAIYSSGSELAQRRLFTSTAYGDLSPCISAYFDTAVGSKRDSRSYGLVADALGLPARAVLFVSDVPAELEAARQAGCQVLLSLRPGNAEVGAATPYERITTFDEVA